MDKYAVKLLSRAYHDIDGIYQYIAKTLLEPGIAEKLIDSLEEVILSLETMPERGAFRCTGVYANRGYRQLLVKNYTIVYRVEKQKREVYVVTVRYSPSQF